MSIMHFQACKSKRPTWHGVLWLTVCLAIPPWPALAQETGSEKGAASLITPATEHAIKQGLEFLAAQQRADGSFGSGGYRGNVAITALAGMAFLSSGSTPERGPYGANVSRCIDYLLANTQQSGFIVHQPTASHGPMYGHGFATLFLAECYGMSPRPELREKLAKAVRLIVNCQNKEGGWRYQPQRLDADISVTVCEVMALRAAKNAGINVPRDTVDRSIEYVKRCQNPDGGFMYTHQGGESAFARSAAALVALYSAGIYEGPEITKGLAYLMQFKPKRGVARQELYYYYGHYYAIQAMWHADRDYWPVWYPAIRDELIARQQKDGSWIDPISVDFATSVALLVLQVPNNYLPIFQR
ncbi:MAG: prenyltransferase/squalene oxidase repeat-containing protein [Thermoguttaceae bacterium]|jgi:hypothetical protein